MTFFIGLMTAFLFLDCCFLILLILVQLPKKDAGMGTAFGGAATDALFGAGTGNALTKLTTYATGIFFGLSLLLSVLNANRSYQDRGRLQEVLKQQAAAPVNPVQPPTLSSNLLESMAKPTATNMMAAPLTNLSNTAKPATNVPALTNLGLTSKPATSLPPAPAK